MKTQLKKVLDNYSVKVGGYKPNPIFYEKTGINHKRFGQLLRGEKELLTSELKSLSDFFQIPITELF